MRTNGVAVFEGIRIRYIKVHCHLSEKNQTNDK